MAPGTDATESDWDGEQGVFTCSRIDLQAPPGQLMEVMRVEAGGSQSLLL